MIVVTIATISVGLVATGLWFLADWWDYLVYDYEIGVVAEVPRCSGNPNEFQSCQRHILRTPKGLHTQPKVTLDQELSKSLITLWKVDPIFRFLQWQVHLAGGKPLVDTIIEFQCCTGPKSRYYRGLLAGVIGNYFIVVHDPRSESSMKYGNFIATLHCPLPPDHGLPFLTTVGRIFFQSWPDHAHGYLSPPQSFRAIVLGPGLVQDTRGRSMSSRHNYVYNNDWVRHKTYISSTANFPTTNWNNLYTTDEQVIKGTSYKPPDTTASKFQRLFQLADARSELWLGDVKLKKNVTNVSTPTFETEGANEPMYVAPASMLWQALTAGLSTVGHFWYTPIAKGWSLAHLRSQQNKLVTLYFYSLLFPEWPDVVPVCYVATP